ncbi:putative polygalacturonase [Forsythia ovata]|uniref:Polygalacturonase n=1 Tax=Forsythia ovata TaxID=205694 RepID=A0ABD1TP18_9LAMI
METAGPQKVHPSSKNLHNIHSESPKASLKLCVLMNQHKDKYPNFNQSNHGVVHGAKRRYQHTFIINFDHFGAKADGQTDDSQAFRNAWNRACNSSKKIIFLIPRHKTYHIRRINFTGPCKSSMKIEIKGTIKSFSELYEDTKRFWIKFHNLRNFEVQGGGIIDGNGEIWWNNSCKIKKTPVGTTIHHVKTEFRFVFEGDQKDSMKTGHTFDGNLCGTRGYILICLKFLISSIGSLGENRSENHVSDVSVDGANFVGTTNGVRIKTWQILDYSRKITYSS